MFPEFLPPILVLLWGFAGIFLLLSAFFFMKAVQHQLRLPDRALQLSS